MKNEIELKEELLLLEAQYMYIVNSGESARNKYWYQKEHQYKSRDISIAMNKCKRELELLKSLNLMTDELNTLKQLRNTMQDVMNNNAILPITYAQTLETLNEQIKEIEEKINKLTTTN